MASSSGGKQGGRQILILRSMFRGERAGGKAKVASMLVGEKRTSDGCIIVAMGHNEVPPPHREIQHFSHFDG